MVFIVKKSMQRREGSKSSPLRWFRGTHTAKICHFYEVEYRLIEPSPPTIRANRSLCYERKGERMNLPAEPQGIRDMSLSGRRSEVVDLAHIHSLTPPPISGCPAYRADLESFDRYFERVPAQKTSFKGFAGERVTSSFRLQRGTR